ncbi:MAG TPA: hypothetical protein VHS28_07290, partial [Chloroflexota bacterium]|nr:hypothetical protein [Chloroflexota bacterium]
HFRPLADTVEPAPISDETGWEIDIGTRATLRCIHEKSLSSPRCCSKDTSEYTGESLSGREAQVPQSRPRDVQRHG